MTPLPWGVPPAFLAKVAIRSASGIAGWTHRATPEKSLVALSHSADSFFSWSAMISSSASGIRTSARIRVASAASTRALSRNTARPARNLVCSMFPATVPLSRPIDAAISAAERLSPCAG